MKVTDIPVIFICPDSSEKYSIRKKHTTNLLEKLGFKNVLMYKSGTEKYPLCLTKAYSEILKNNLNDDPLLILEDDVEVSQWYHEEIEYPQDTDAFYLGFSKCGGSKTDNIDEGSSIVDYIDSKYIRILNMLSTHATIYISKRYKQAVIDIFDNIIKNEIPYYNDVLISRIQANYNVYGYYYPFFYQSPNLGNNPHVERMTNFLFKNKRSTVIVTAYYPLEKSKYPLHVYKLWIALFFRSVSANVICFCPPEEEKHFRSIIGPNVTLIVRHFHSFKMMNEEHMTIWRDFHKIDSENFRHSPELYAIWGAKQEFVRQAMKLTDANIFVWCDIGCFREQRDGNFKNTYRFISSEKITCLSILDTIGGGVLAGDRDAWNTFSNLYLDELYRNPHGKDQVIYKRILNHDNAIIIRAKDDFGDPWFYLTNLFSQ